jgi:phospholipase/carboxylesterase
LAPLLGPSSAAFACYADCILNSLPRLIAMPYTRQETSDVVTLTPMRTATAAVIWLHGLGADGNDFVPLVNELHLPEALQVRFVFPHAPRRPVTINGGYVMRAWYDIKGLGPGNVEDEAGVRASALVVDDLIKRELAAGIAARNIVIAGFSQGGAIALHAGLRYPQRLGGVMALSTYLPLRNTLASEGSSANRDVPILMCHGTRDGVVPPTMGQTSHDLMVSLGYEVNWKTYPMEHTLCLEEVADITAWLQQHLNAIA